MKLDSRIIMRRALGMFLLIATIGLATCQSVLNSFAGTQPPAPAASPETRR